MKDKVNRVSCSKHGAIRRLKRSLFGVSKEMLETNRRLVVGIVLVLLQNGYKFNLPIANK